MKLRRNSPHQSISHQYCFHQNFLFLFSVKNDHCHAGIKDKFQLSLLECQRKRYRRETNKGKTDSASQLRRSGLRISGLRHFPGILNLTWMFQSYFIIHYMFSSYIISYYISKLFRYLLRIMNSQTRIISALINIACAFDVL